MGKKKYGVPLRAHNGRNALQDAYEEAQDMMLYLKQALVEEEDSTIDVDRALAYAVAKAVLAEYQKKSKNTLLISFKTWLDKAVDNSVGKK
jgi:Fe-S cluster assembly ATPase SufC